MNDLTYKLRLMWAYKDAIRTRVPILFKHMINTSQQNATDAARRLRDKNRIDVAFLLTIPGMWKLDYLFQQMQQTERFHPYIVIFPYSQFKGFDKKEIWDTIKRTEEFVKMRNFEYVIPYNEKKERWDNIRHTLNPDIVFFTTPYRDILPDYYYYNFRDKLTCYVPYAFQAMNVYPLNYDQIAINLFGINFAETKMHLDFAHKYSRSKGANFVVSGYPGIEVYLRDDYKSPDVWRKQSCTKKRVIWAPHHTIDGSDDFQVSTFLQYYDQMLQLALEFKDQIQWAFKPHQLLKFKLQKLWGKEKTDKYYGKWAEMENCQLEETGYVDLFIHSDAMIHDSGSFTTEYLFLNKPVMYLVKDNNPEQQFNDFGALAFSNHYQGKDIFEIKRFLIDVVINGKDTMKAQRKDFYNRYLVSPDGKLPSQRIIEIINDKIDKS